MSYWSMMILAGAYVVITIFCAIEKRGWDALYWLGALAITISLLGRR